MNGIRHSKLLIVAAGELGFVVTTLDGTPVVAHDELDGINDWLTNSYSPSDDAPAGFTVWGTDDAK